MSVVKRNVVANASGSAWALLVSLAAVPFYIRFLGIEAYGVIGVFLSLTAIFSLLDFGLRATLNRRFAQLSVESGNPQEMRDLLRTLEIIYWGVGIAIGVSVMLIAPLVAAYWINPRQISIESAERALTLIGIVIACQWPLALYSGGMMGLQKQVKLNILTSFFAAVRSAGAVFILWNVSSTLEAFFTWFIFMSFAETVSTAIILWRSLPQAPSPATFRINKLAALWRFAVGMTGISVLSVILTQLDKVILSAVLSLEEFGYYALAWRIAAALYSLSSPITSAFFPRFAQLAVDGNGPELARLYHRGCQLTSVLVLSVAAVLVFFSRDFLYLWTADTSIASYSSDMLSLLILGTALNALMGLPVTLQIAHGWTRLVLYVGTTAVVLLAPMIYFMSMRFGGLGAAFVWLVLNLGYMLFMLRIMHRRLLPGELRQWFVADTGIPFLAAFLVAASWKMGVDAPVSYVGMLLNLSGVSLATLVAAILAAPEVRAMVIGEVRGYLRI